MYMLMTCFCGQVALNATVGSLQAAILIKQEECVFNAAGLPASGFGTRVGGLGRVVPRAVKSVKDECVAAVAIGGCRPSEL